MQGKSVLKTQEKFYLADQSIKYALYCFNPTSIAAMLENVVYIELKRRGYDVYIGKNLDKEIDFVSTLRDEKFYIQVCRELPKESDRELANPMEINDNYPKMVVTLDDYANGNVNGIKIVHIVDFLLNKTYKVYTNKNTYVTVLNVFVLGVSIKQINQYLFNVYRLTDY